MKTLDVQAKEYFDKGNANSYFSAQVIVDMGLPTENTLYIPFKYGYGNQYEHEAAQILKLHGYMPKDAVLWRYCNDNNIIIRSNIETGLSQPVVKSWGTK